MYWIDINLLNDREEFAADFGPPALQEQQNSKAPIAIGLGVGAAAIAIAFGAYSMTGFFNNKLAAEEQALDQKIAQLEPQLEDINVMQAKVQTIQSQTNALAKIFNQIKPWSAMLADLRDRIPSTLQIEKIAQTPIEAPPQPNAPQGQSDQQPPPVANQSSGSNLTLSGSAISFGDVNDFILTLRQSNYLSPDASETKLKDATRKEEANKTNLVTYEINTQVNDAPAESLLTALRVNGASGLVSRIETLKRQGVIKP